MYKFLCEACHFKFSIATDDEVDMKEIYCPSCHRRGFITDESND